LWFGSKPGATRREASLLLWVVFDDSERPIRDLLENGPRFYEIAKDMSSTFGNRIKLTNNDDQVGFAGEMENLGLVQRVDSSHYLQRASRIPARNIRRSRKNAFATTRRNRIRCEAPASNFSH
jgi:hypothetical protein